MIAELLLIVTTGWSVVDAPKDVAKKEREQEQLQGTWTPVSAEKGGMKASKQMQEDMKELRLIVKGDRIQLSEKGKVRKGVDVSFRLDPAAKPKAVDIVVGVEMGKPQVVKAIYSLDGDMLKVCYQPEVDKDRPREFKTRVGSEVMLVVFVREKP